MRLSDAWLRCRPTKLIYPNHRLPPWLTEDTTPRSLEPIVRHRGARRCVPRTATQAQLQNPGRALVNAPSRETKHQVFRAPYTNEESPRQFPIRERGKNAE